MLNQLLTHFYLLQRWQNMSNFFLHTSSLVDKNSIIGNNTKIWHWSHVSKNTKIGENCTIGQNVFIGEGVKIGNNVKIQNNVSIFTGVEIEDNVFCGPSCVFTNVKNPRSFISRNKKYENTLVNEGATIGANVTVVCGTKLGCYSFVGAGSVVTNDVNDYSMVVGNPAKHISWVSKSGYKLNSDFYCEFEKQSYNFLKLK